MVKRVYRRKSSALDVLLRSGSIGRDNLVEISKLLLAESYDLRLSFTSKYKLLSRIVVPLPLEGGMTPVNGVNVLRSVAEILDLSWPCQMAIGYALGSEDHHLPGEIVYRDPLRNAGYQLGKSVGKLLRKTISQFVNKPTSCRLLLASDNAQLPIMNDVNLEMRFKASALDQFCKELEGVGKRARTLATLQRFTV